MGYNLASLPAYIEQQEYPLIHKSLFKAKTASIVRKQVGVKGQATINILDDSSTFQAGGCGFSPVGGDATTLSQRTITVAYIKVDKSFCPSQLNGYYAQAKLNAGSYNEEIPFWDVFSELQAGVIAQQVETALWQSNTSSANPNLSQFTGFISNISGCTGVVSVTGTTGSGITTSNVLTIMDSIYAAIPEVVLDKDDLRILVGFDVYRTFTTALKNANLYHYPVGNKDADITSDFEQVLPGTTIKVVAVHGLDGQNQIFAARLSNLVMGVDLETETEDAGDKFQMWYSQDFQEVRMTCKFKVGTQVAFCNEIVYFSLH
jgi:hypothetical protein